MNIFNALRYSGQSTYSGHSLREEHYSSLLAYFLTPHESHGLGDSFLVEFIRAIIAGIENSDDQIRSLHYVSVGGGWKVDITLEDRYGDSREKKRRADIGISINWPVKRNLNQKMKIIIENKINPEAADENHYWDNF